MNGENLIGTIEPLTDDVGGMFGWSFSGDYLKMSGLIVTTTHPSSISISESSIDFTYTVGGQAVSRSYGLTRDGPKRITAFTNPDGTVTEVSRSG